MSTAYDRFSDAPAPLFDDGRVDEPVNPRVAAKEAVRDELPELRRRVLDVLKRRGDYGATDEELQALCSMGPNTQRPRRRELVQLGYVADSGKRRALKSGKLGTVWIALQRSEKE